MSRALREPERLLVLLLELEHLGKRAERGGQVGLPRAIRALHVDDRGAQDRLGLAQAIFDHELLALDELEPGALRDTVVTEALELAARELDVAVGDRAIRREARELGQRTHGLQVAPERLGQRQHVLIDRHHRVGRIHHLARVGHQPQSFELEQAIAECVRACHGRGGDLECLHVALRVGQPARAIELGRHLAGHGRAPVR
jgi:hypothetical protein